VVGLSLDEVTAFWGLPRWPEGEAAFDLGGRRLTVFPIPGHEATHVALWDERTGVLIAGDTLYPGLLTVRDWPAFRASAARMAGFAQSHPVTMVLGHHIEMARAPGVLLPSRNPVPAGRAPAAPPGPRPCTTFARPARRWPRRRRT
jgi:glyoxylase-like metal-dependent hydrolase (beta-lactamase superfamily II)